MIEFNHKEEELILTCDYCGAEVENLYNLEGDQVCSQCVFEHYEEKAQEFMDCNEVDADAVYQEMDEQNRTEAEEDLAESWRDE